MFTTPCFIRKNTSELRRKLESLGYKKGAYPLPVGREDVYDRDIHLYENSYHFRNSTLYGITNNIDCGTNEELFIALASLRDDSDINQYFICDKVSFTLGKTYYPDDYLYYQYDEFFDKQNWHKATVEELIEYFKKE